MHWKNDTIFCMYTYTIAIHPDHQTSTQHACVSNTQSPNIACMYHLIQWLLLLIILQLQNNKNFHHAVHMIRSIIILLWACMCHACHDCYLTQKCFELNSEPTPILLLYIITVMIKGIAYYILYVVYTMYTSTCYSNHSQSMRAAMPVCLHSKRNLCVYIHACIL